MERLTNDHNMGDSLERCHALENFLRLKDYEDTELSPEEIHELKRIAKSYANTGLTPEGIKRLIKMFEIRGELLNACSIEGVIFNDVRCYKKI